MSKVTRDTSGLANAMFDELDALISGKSTPQQARAKSNLAGTIIATKRLEMDMSRFVADERSSAAPVALKAVKLGG